MQVRTRLEPLWDRPSPDPPVRVSTVGPDAVLRISLHGEIDAFTAPLLEQSLDHLDVGSLTAIVVDARDLSFMDCAGLHACLRLSARAEREDVRFALTNVASGPAKVFRLTGNDRLIDRSWATGGRTPPVERSADVPASIRGT
jgi:anti-sigma B factor antagonist